MLPGMENCAFLGNRIPGCLTLGLQLTVCWDRAVTEDSCNSDQQELGATTFGLTIYWLYDLGEVSEPLCAVVSLAVD